MVVAANLRSDDLREAEARRINEAIEAIRREAALRADFAEKLANAEAKRIDAIRAVDVNAVAVANERATAQATVLANQLSTSAETNRSLVATTAANIATQLATLTSQLTDRISQLERSSYEGQGKSTVADPALANALAGIQSTLAALQKGSSETTGRAGLSTPLLVSLTAGAMGLVVYIVDHIK